MKPFCHASLVSADKCNLPLSLDDGWRCRVALIAPGIGRMLMLPPEGLRELRTWSVLNGADPWQGADRLGLFADAAPATLTQDHDNLSLDNGRLRVRVSLAPFGLAWDQSSDGNTWQACCADRPTFAYANATTGALGHWQARDGHDQYFGLGDKTGPLNKAGRRWW